MQLNCSLLSYCKSVVLFPPDQVILCSCCIFKKLIPLSFFFSLHLEQEVSQIPHFPSMACFFSSSHHLQNKQHTKTDTFEFANLLFIDPFCVIHFMGNGLFFQI